MTQGAAIAVLSLVTIGLATADKFLARVESAEARSTAEHSFAAGERLLDQGKVDAAIDDFREAHSLARQNDAYGVQLVAALVKGGRINDAEPLLAEILQREPNDGKANLIAARLKVREGDPAEAEAHYHRAIYGRWSSGGDLARVGVRMELIEHLARAHRTQELLAELIALEAEEPADAKIQHRIGELFLLADSPARAGDVYRGLIEKDPEDAAAYEGLGEAELEQGRYSAAHDAFERASRRDPANESARTHLATLSAVTELDPTLRQITSAEKYRRSVGILQMARQESGSCGGKLPDLAAADAAIQRPMPAHATNEAAEALLALAENLWHAEPATCGARSEALRLIMRKLAA